MSMYIRTGRFISDGGDVSIPVGFIPDWLRIVEMSGGSAGIVMLEWFRQSEQIEASGAQEGFNVKEGNTEDMDDGAGIVAYDTSGEAPTISDWTTTASTNATARTNFAAGTFVRPVAKEGSVPADREAIYECVFAGTGGSTEPTWNKGIGETTVDGTTIWEAVREPLRRSGYKGFKFFGTEQTDGDSYYYIAIKSDEFNNHGDVDGWTGGVENA